ncbi:hypothetical protein ACFOQM_00640 [Paenibacillus sp. GCM10012307]|uniref:hypothetical protein n=1 Tax=Paenibacillus sp. GCM10012307 TaxID=3317343 RepID=UPI0036101C96
MTADLNRRVALLYCIFMDNAISTSKIFTISWPKRKRLCRPLTSKKLRFVVKYKLIYRRNFINFLYFQKSVQARLKIEDLNHSEGVLAFGNFQIKMGIRNEWKIGGTKLGVAP